MKYLNLNKTETSACNERQATSLYELERAMEMRSAYPGAYDRLRNLTLTFPIYYYVSSIPSTPSKKFIDAVPLY